MDVNTYFIFVILTLTFKLSLALDWSYSGTNGPQNWSLKYPDCSKQGQSPRNINYGQTVYDSTLSALKFINYDKEENFTLVNDNHRIQGRVTGSKTYCQFMPGGKFYSEKFVAREFHFHWGDETSEGSEHQMNSKKFPAELHIVHYNNKYKDFKSAAIQSDGLAIVSVIFDVSIEDNPALNNVIEVLPSVNFEGYKKDIRVSLQGFLPTTREYFYYPGTLTTPPCTASANWFIFKERVPISEKQLQLFRKVHDSPDDSSPENMKFMGDNFRPINQSLVSSKPITRSFDTIGCDKGLFKGYTALCSMDIGNKSVNYALTLNQCVLPKSVTLQVNIPDNFSVSRTTFVDIDYEKPIKLGSLDKQVRLELHGHPRGDIYKQHIHVTVYQESSNLLDKKVVLSTYFKLEPCSQAQCDKKSDGVYNCKHVVEDDLGKMNLTFKVELIDGPPLQFKLTVLDPDMKTVSSGMFGLHGGNVVLALRSKPSPVVGKTLVLNNASFGIMTTTVDNSIKVQFTMGSSVYPWIAVMKMIDVSFIMPKYPPTPTSSSKKITIGVAIVLLMLTMIGLAGVLVWRRYRSSAYQEPGLVGEMEIDGDGDMNVSFR